MPLDHPATHLTGTVTDLQATGLAKSFGKARPVFEGLEFRIRRGECVALVGANGTGKSTLLRCCLGLITPDSGRVSLLDQDMVTIKGPARRALRARTGLVGQKHNLVPRLSVLSNVIHGLLGRHSGPRYWVQGLAPAAARTAAFAALDKVGLADLALRRADQLSGGQSQRVAIARALVGNPRFLVADEPCASLDPQAGEEVMALFISLVKREGVTVLFTSHNVQHALSYGDRILGLQGGRIAIDARARDVSAQDMARLYV
ncbi:phosphonate ABC transporter ATP-binding protein [Frigidibacter sp.]|uniref:phosphonate ABC transporter ATP-binding protein n=1 Tax=Frigidibacter sp. TaxID=2586418 RepID=UPI002734BA88|nr:ATP-binding cassette domain-containing protein [Frigidibacter sp.]MDP3338745.1 ATP-binding cassette domain-containing protein [Frigidibacter sp.]